MEINIEKSVVMKISRIASVMSENKYGGYILKWEKSLDTSEVKEGRIRKKLLKEYRLAENCII